MGRKSKFSKKKWDRICSEIASGRSVRELCANEEWAPDASTFYRWFNRVDDEGFATYLRAREIQAHAVMDEIPDWIHDPGMDPNEKRANGYLAEIYAKRCAPKKYGDRQAIEHSGMSEITIVSAIPEPDPNWGNQGDEDDGD